MFSDRHILWEVDTQRDFMLPGGNLYVPGAEKLLPNLRRLTDAARHNQIFLVSHGCFHTPDDPEFSTFPPHCVKGTTGAEFVPEALADEVLRVPNEPSTNIPENLFDYQQILLEKQTLNIFESRHAESLLTRLNPDAEFLVFGVVTEYCVQFAAAGLLVRGRKVSLIRDAIETLDPMAGNRALDDLVRQGAHLTTTYEALAAIEGRSKADKQ